MHVPVRIVVAPYCMSQTLEEELATDDEESRSLRMARASADTGAMSLPSRECGFQAGENPDCDLTLL